MNGTAFDAYWQSQTDLRVYDKRDTASGGICNFTGLNSANGPIKLRIMRNTSGATSGGIPNNTFSCELWNNDGTGYQSHVDTITAADPGGWPYTGGSWGDTAGIAQDVAFYRVMTTLVPLGSLSPVTYNALVSSPTITITELKCDGTLLDSTSNGNNITLMSPTYTATPGLVAFSKLTNLGFPTVLATVVNSTPLRAGNPGQLDGTNSFSMTPIGSSVTYFWQCLSGPSTPIWISQTASQPTLVGLVFGDYLMQLTVTDAAGNVATSTQDIGVVATDANWIVVDAQPTFSNSVWGDSIAFGHNPWAYSDWANANAVTGAGSEIGTPSSGAFISADWNVPISGSCYIVSATMTCTGMNLQTIFGGGTSTWVGNAKWPILWYADSNVAGRIGRQPLRPIDGSSAIPTSTTMTLDITDYPIYANAVCTSMSPCTIAGSNNWLNAINNGSGSYGYYDGATMFEAFYRRTGIQQYSTWGSTLASIEVTAPGIDQGVYVVTQARVNPSRQWAVQQVYYPSGANFSTFQLGLRNWATRFGYLFNSPGYSYSAQSQLVNGVQVNCYPFCVSDTRENGAALIDVAAAAYVETDSGWKTTLNTMLENAWLNMFSTQQQPDGSWDISMNGTPGPVVNVTAGSTSVTANGSTTFTSTSCGTVRTMTGTVSGTNGGFTVTGVGTNFTAATSSDTLIIYGTYSGNYGKQIFTGITINSDTSISLPTPVNLDSGSGLSYMLNSGPYVVFIANNSTGTQVPFTPDTNWYTCTYVDSTHLTLDQTFKNSTMTIAQMNVNFSGDTQGDEPYMSAFVSAGLKLGSLVGTTHASQMLTASNALYPFYSGRAWVPSFKGAYFQIGFGECQPGGFPLADLCASPQQNARMFGVEPVRALASAYQNAPTSPKYTFLQQYYGAEWGNPKYGSSPYSDGGYVDDCADGWSPGSYLKYVYQCFALGSSASMPAALLGGVAPAQPTAVGIGFAIGVGTKYPNATQVTVTATAPTGVVGTPVTCTVSPCYVTVDGRQGGANIQIQYQTSTATLASDVHVIGHP
jgi:hypothetical protein